MNKTEIKMGEEFLREIKDVHEKNTKTYDQFKKLAFWIIGLIAVPAIVMGVTQLTTVAVIAEKTDNNTDQIHHIKQNYVDATMFSLFVRTFEIQQEEILGIKEGDIEKVKAAQAKYRELRSAMANIQTRSANETK